MDQKQVKSITISLYPSQVKKVERMMRALRVRKFSQAIQRLVDDAEEPAVISEDHGQMSVAARP